MVCCALTGQGLGRPLLHQRRPAPVRPGSGRYFPFFISFMQPNKIAGTWHLVSAQLDPAGSNMPLYGPTPSGQLIFTTDGFFSVVVHDPGVAPFAAGMPGQGTAAENQAAVVGSLGLFGTYTVDEEGEFLSEEVIGCTFPNWNGLRRTRSQLTETVTGNRMVERLTDPGSPLIVLVWERAR